MAATEARAVDAAAATTGRVGAWEVRLEAARAAVVAPVSLEAEGAASAMAEKEMGVGNEREATEEARGPTCFASRRRRRRRRVACLR